MPLRHTPAILLRSYPYSETSQILRFYTEGFGMVGALARGTRKSGGRRGGSLSTFAQGELTLHFRDNRDLQTFREFAPSHSRRGLAQHPLRLAAASVLGELILQHAEGEGSPTLFHGLAEGLDALEVEPMDSILTCLLVSLWGLIGVLGYAPVLTGCVECGRGPGEDELFRFDFAAGGLRCPECQEGVQGPRLGPVARDQLAGLLRGSCGGALQRPRAHLRLVSDFITYHISGGTPFRTLEILATLLPETHA